jgi:hypothetical protein
MHNLQKLYFNVFRAIVLLLLIWYQSHFYIYTKLHFTEEYGQYYGQMNTNGRMMTVKRDGLPYEEMGYCPPPNRKLPPVPGQHSNYNTIDRIKNGNYYISLH